MTAAVPTPTDINLFIDNHPDDECDASLPARLDTVKLSVKTPDAEWGATLAKWKSHLIDTTEMRANKTGTAVDSGLISPGLTESSIGETTTSKTPESAATTTAMAKNTEPASQPASCLVLCGSDWTPFATSGSTSRSFKENRAAKKATKAVPKTAGVKKTVTSLHLRQKVWRSDKQQRKKAATGARPAALAVVKTKAVSTKSSVLAFTTMVDDGPAGAFEPIVKVDGLRPAKEMGHRLHGIETRVGCGTDLTNATGGELVVRGEVAASQKAIGDKITVAKRIQQTLIGDTCSFEDTHTFDKETTETAVVVDHSSSVDERIETLFNRVGSTVAGCHTGTRTTNGGELGLLSPSESQTGRLVAMSPSSHIDASPAAVIPTTSAGDVDPGELASETSTAFGGIAGVLSPSSCTRVPIRASPEDVGLLMGILASETSTTNGGAAELPSPSSHRPTPKIRASSAVVIPTPGGATETNAGCAASNKTPAVDGWNSVGAGSNIQVLFIFVLFVLPLWALSRLALRKTHGVRGQRHARSRGRTRLPARRVPRRRCYVFRTIGGGCWALALLLGGGGGQHLLFVEATAKGTLTDAEFKLASWGTSDFKRG